jgi:hypothetical protein
MRGGRHVAVTDWRCSFKSSGKSSGPLWSTLPKADLKPVVSAVEADLGAYLEAASGGADGCAGMPVALARVEQG